MAVNTVQEHCPGHSNAAKREVYVYDRLTGKPIVRIKPALDRAQNDSTASTSAGPYLFVHDSGGVASGGLPDAGQQRTPRLHGSCRESAPVGRAPRQQFRRTGGMPAVDGIE